MTDMKWYDSQVAEVAAKLNTGIERGLAAEDARARLAEHGANELAESKQASALMLFLLQFKNSLLIILLIGAALSVYTGLVADAIAITFLVFFNAIISFVQEHKANNPCRHSGSWGPPTRLSCATANG